MGRIRTVKLNKKQRIELEQGYNGGPSAVFRKRCHVILLKSAGRSSADVSAIVGMNQVSINNWLTRYETEGIEGLKNKPGQGRKPILEPVILELFWNDLQKIRVDFYNNNGVRHSRIYQSSIG